MEIIDPSSLELTEEEETWREEIAEMENKNTEIVTSNSAVSLAWAIIELALVVSCKEIKKKLSGSNFDISKRDRLKEIRDFFLKHKITIPGKLYCNLSELQKVRHCVVHAAGLVLYSDKEKELLNLVKHRRWLRLSDEHDLEDRKSLIVEQGFLTEILRSLEQWLEKSLESLGFGPRTPTGIK